MMLLRETMSFIKLKIEEFNILIMFNNDYNRYIIDINANKQCLQQAVIVMVFK